MQGKIKFTLEQAMKTQRGVQIYRYPLITLALYWRTMVSAKPRPLYPRKRAPLTLVKEAGWAPGPVLISMENRNSLIPTWFRNPDRPARSGVAVRSALFWPPRKNEACIDTKLRHANGCLSL